MRLRAGERLGLAGTTAILLHLGVLGLLAMRPGAPSVRDYDEDAFEVALVPPVYLPRRAKPPPASAPAPRPARASSPTVAPLPFAAAPVAAAPASPGPAQALDGDISLALRRRLGCARTDPSGLSWAERQACADALGRGARQAAALGQPVPAGKQAYYDAVKAARQSEGHGPGIGCHIRFGGGKPASVETPAHGLKLGPLPCFVVPPAGMLSPEVDVPNPY